jgi:Lrp/AsnC family transcriptional regulator for asnA, asnC and gidA
VSAVDDTDRAIIAALQQDGRASFTQIAASIGLTEGAIRRRVQRLTDSGAIQIVAVADPLALSGKRVAMITIRVTGDVERTARWMSRLPEVEYLVATAGRFDLMGEVMVDDDEHLMRVLSTLRSRADVAEAEALPCLKLFKQTFAWSAPRDPGEARRPRRTPTR